MRNPTGVQMPYSELKFMQWVINASQYTRLRCSEFLYFIHMSSIYVFSFALTAAAAFPQVFRIPAEEISSWISIRAVLSTVYSLE